MPYRSYYTLLTIGITSFLLATLCVVYEVTPFIITEVELHILLATTALSHLFFYNLNSWHKYIFNVQRLFTRIIIFGMAVAIVSVIGATADTMQALPPAGMRGVKMLMLYGIMSYFTYSVTMFRKLIFVRRNIAAERQWRAFITALVVAMVIGLPLGFIPNLLRHAILITGFLVGVALLNRIKWIAELGRTEKWLLVFYLLITCLINLALLQTLISLQNLEYVFLKPLHHNVFGAVLVGTASFYPLFALVALIFTLPVSSVIEDQMAEINSFQEMGLALQRHYEDATEILQQLFQVCQKNTAANAGWLLLNPLQPDETCHFSDISSDQIGRINVWINFKNLIQKEPESGYWYYPNLDRYHILHEPESPYKSLLILPIFTQPNSCEAVICLTKGFAEGFDKHTVNGCKSFINQAKLAIVNARLVQDSIRSARYKEELQIATEVQQALLPQQFPQSAYFDIAAFNEPAKEVGGDYYDYAQTGDKLLSLIMADVSGKGASAAFHMAQMKGIFQSLMQLRLVATDFLLMANRSVAQCLEKNRFITAVYVQLNFETAMLTYARAGHPPMIYYQAAQNKAFLVASEGLGLGIIRNNDYARFVKVSNMRFAHNDVLVLYTDGLVEGRKNESAAEQYGYINLTRCLEQNHHLSAAQITQAIYEDYALFTRNSDYRDDTAILVIKIGTPNEPFEPAANTTATLPDARIKPSLPDAL
ncbi:MAG TPA: PP2C family protein-serine/threonine phosphatase [Chitinophagales bacterium]|nr:PP2C family protein-serine/threonine phosphatase [Chitinophagales bacterium]